MNLLVGMAPRVICFPTRLREWERVAEGFESLCGIPNVAGAVDGTLFQIERPFEFDGYLHTSTLY